MTCLQLLTLRDASELDQGQDRSGNDDLGARELASGSCRGRPSGFAQSDETPRRFRSLRGPVLRAEPELDPDRQLCADLDQWLALGALMPSVEVPEPSSEPEAVAALAASVLEDEFRRAEATVQPDVLLADADLPGAGDEQLSLGEALRVGGMRTVAIISTIAAAADDGQRCVQRPGSGHPEIARRVRRSTRRDRRRHRRPLRCWRDPDLVALRPAAACTTACDLDVGVVGHPRVRRACAKRLPDVPRPARRGNRTVRPVTRIGAAADRYLPHHGPRPCVRSVRWRGKRLRR